MTLLGADVSHRNQHNTAWTFDKKEKLKELFLAGLSGGAIGHALGVTRNSVIGTIHRMGLKRSKCDSSSPTTAHNTKAFKPRRARLQANSGPLTHFTQRKRLRVALVEAPDTSPAELTFIKMSAFDAAIPIKQRLTLFQLNGHTCKWSIGNPGEPDFFFCGGAPVSGFPYCPQHAIRAYRA
jgi:GcrA cell cycle regulator